MNLTIDKAVAERMSADRILEEDVAAVIEECETTGRYLIDTETGRRIGHLQRGYLTYWVEYDKTGDDGFAVQNAYSHRMVIKEEYGAENNS